MATLLLIDDDPDLFRDRVSHVLPRPHTGLRSHKRAQRAWNGSPPLARTLFSSTCACPTSPAWTS